MSERIRLTTAMRELLLEIWQNGSAYPLDRNHQRTFEALEVRDCMHRTRHMGKMADHPARRDHSQTTHGKEPRIMQVSFTAHTPAHSPLTIQQRLEAAGFTNVHVNAISDTVEPFTRTNPETIQAYEEGKQLMEARYGRFDAMKEARHINPYRDGDR